MPLSADDRLQIYELYARYARYYDFGMGAEFAATFSPDGHFIRSGMETSLRGPEALAAFVAERYEAAPGCIHQTGNIFLDELEEGLVKGNAYAVVLRLAPGDSLRCRNLGWYDDRIVRTDQGWRFLSREYACWADPETVDVPFVFEGGAGLLGVPLPAHDPASPPPVHNQT